MKIKLITILSLFLAILFFACLIFAESKASISITGLVKQPLSLSADDLGRFQSVTVQLNEVLKDKTYKGAYYYKGVALRTLLDTAFIEKKVKTFSKDIDLAIKVIDREGRSVVLSWGEVYYRNSGDIIIATSATPIKPHKNCASFHEDVNEPQCH
jgi:hypothetical protein